jgi:hypothetical protein
VTLVNSAGVPIHDRYGEPNEKKLPPLGDPHLIAGRLTKEAWQARGGDKRNFTTYSLPKYGLAMNDSTTFDCGQ